MRAAGLGAGAGLIRGDLRDVRRTDVACRTGSVVVTVRDATNPLITALDGGAGLPRLDSSQLRATWLADVADLLGLATFMRAGPCSRRAGTTRSVHSLPS